MIGSYASMFEKYIEPDVDMVQVVACQPTSDLSIAIGYWANKKYITILSIEKHEEKVGYFNHNIKLTELGSATWTMKKL